MGEEFEGEFLRNLCDRGITCNDLLEELCLLTRRAGRARQRVIDEKVQRALSVLVVDIPNMGDNLRDQRAVLDRLGAQVLVFPLFDLDLWRKFKVDLPPMT